MFGVYFLFDRLVMINEFLNKMRQVLNDDEFEEFNLSLSNPPKRGLVFNNLVMDKNDFLNNFKYNLEKLSYDEDCYILNSEDKMGGDIFHHLGAIYMQEPSAMIPGFCLPLKKGDIVLDACASPGGKTFQIAKKLDGVLISNEIDFERAKILNANVERLGLKNVIVTNFDAVSIAKNYPNKFDCVLVDAPCSGEGMFRKEDKAVTRWSQEYVELCAERQKEILLNYDKALKQGGYLMYSTCTYSIEENEEVVAFLVDLGYKIVDIGFIEGATDGLQYKDYDTKLCKRFYPHKSKGEGQFVCLLQKICENDENCVYVRTGRFKIGATEYKLLMQFFKDNFENGVFDEIKENLIQKGENIYYVKDKSLIVDESKIINYGVRLGSVVKNRFEPHHNLFKSFNRFLRKVDLIKIEAIDYLKGNTIDVEMENGWCVVSYLNAPLGGGKIVNGMLKNHYPKGLRLIK